MFLKQAKLAAYCAASAIILPAVANAQVDSNLFDRGDVLPVDQRGNAETDPVPFPVGIFIVQPSVDFSFGLTSNQFATETSEEQASMIGFVPSFELSSAWSQHAMGGILKVDHVENSDFDSESRTNVQIGLDGRFDLSPSTSLFGEFISEDLTEDRTAFSNIAGSLEPNEYSRLAGGLGIVHQAQRWQFDANLDYAMFDYDDAELPGDLFLDQDLRDQDQIQGRVRLAYAMASDWAAYTQAERVEADFDPPGIFNAFNRDYEGNILSVGSDFAFGDSVRGDIGIGFLSYTFNDPAFDDIEDVSVSGNIQWTLAEQTTLETELKRGVIDPGLAATLAALETGVNVRLAHGLSSNVFLIGEAGLNTYEFETIDRSDDRVDVLVGANWKLNKNIWLESNYELRNSSSPIQEFSENRILFRMRVFP